MSQQIQISGGRLQAAEEEQARQGFMQALRQQIAEMRDMQREGAVGGAFNPETLESFDELIRINQLGLLTADSQQGLMSRGRVPVDRALYAKISSIAWPVFEERREYYEDADFKEDFLRPLGEVYESQGGRWTEGVDSKERAYLTGYLDTTRARQLADILNQQDLVAFTTDGDADIETTGSTVFIPVTCETIELGPGLGQYSPHDSAPLVCPTNLNSRGNPPSWYYPTIPEASDKYLAQISIMDPRWGHKVTEPDGLFKRVIAALEEMNAVAFASGQ